jgi:hypothetical protein
MKMMYQFQAERPSQSELFISSNVSLKKKSMSALFYLFSLPHGMDIETDSYLISRKKNANNIDKEYAYPYIIESASKIAKKTFVFEFS